MTFAVQHALCLRGWLLRSQFAFCLQAGLAHKWHMTSSVVQGDFSRPLGLELYHNPYNDEEESAREALEHDEAVVRDRVLAPWAVGIMGLERLWRGVEELEAMEQEERELVADEARRETEEEYAAFQAFLGSLQDSRVEVLQWYQEIARVIVAEEFRAFKELVMYIGALIAERKKLDRAHDQSRKLIEQQILPHWHQTIGDAHSWNTVLAMMRLEIREEEVALGPLLPASTPGSMLLPLCP